MVNDNYQDYRLRVFNLAKKAFDLNLVTGAEGNFSVRIDGNLFAITPSAVEYDEMVVDDIVVLNLVGEKIFGNRDPSSEWRLHAEIYREIEEVNAVVHTHPIFSTIISIIREEIPVLLDEQIFYIGGSLRVSEYKPSGTIDLAKAVLKALVGRKAAIIANHGLVSVGKDEKAALYTAIVAEKLAKVYFYTKLIGKINTISEEVVKELMSKRYGRYTG